MENSTAHADEQPIVPLTRVPPADTSAPSEESGGDGTEPIATRTRVPE